MKDNNQENIEQQEEAVEENVERESKKERVNMPLEAFNNRLDQARSGARKSLVKDFGFEDEESFAQFVKDANELKSRLMSDEEKRQEALEQLRKENAALEERLKEASAKIEKAENELRQKALDATIANFVGGEAFSTDDVISYLKLKKNGELQDALNDDGAYDESKLKELIDVCKEERPHYFKLATKTGNQSHKKASNQILTNQQKENILKRGRY